MLGKRPYLPSFDQDRPSPNPVSSSSACRRVIIGFEIGAKEDTNQPLSLGMHRQTSLAAMSSLFSHKKGNPSFRPDKPETVLVVDPPPTTTSSTLPGTLVIPNPKQHPLSLAQPEVEKKKTMVKSAPWRQSPAQTAVARSVFDAHVETKGLPPSFLSSSSSFSSCFEEIACEHPARLDFLQSCFFCRLSLSMARDIYMYRGDRAFCSVDCRYQQIVIDERNDRCSLTSPMPGARSRTNTTTYAS